MSYTYRSSVSFGGDEDDKSPDIIYYNGDIINNSTDTPENSDPQIRFSETRDVPILRDASLYNFSIVRFTMNGPGKDIPLFIPQIETNPAFFAPGPTPDINQTVYNMVMSATLTFEDVAGNPRTYTIFSADALASAIAKEYGQWVQWEPEVTDPTLAPTPTIISLLRGEQDLSSRYYWATTYSWWLNLVNKALKVCLSQIQSQFNTLYTTPIANGGWGQAGPAPTLGTTAPYLTYNPNNNLFTLNADAYGYGFNPVTGEISTTSSTNVVTPTVGQELFNLFWNENMYGLFSNFKNNYSQSNNWTALFTAINTAIATPMATVPNGWGTGLLDFYNIIVENINYQNVLTTPVIPAPGLGDKIPSPTASKSYYQMVQDYESTSTLWSPVASIVFTSGFLPIVNELTGFPIRFGTSNTGGSSASVPSAFQPIITDVALANTSASDYRGFINYTPTAEYRITSFTKGKNEIRQIDIQVWWKNRLDGALYPLQMFNLSSCSLKIMFRKRGATIHGLGKGERGY